MTGKGGSTSAPPAIDHQREGKSLRVGMNRRVDKTPAWRVHGSSREGFMMKGHVWTGHLAALVVGKAVPTREIPGWTLHGSYHEGVNDERDPSAGTRSSRWSD
jgi:hypothetical protein